VKGFWGYVRRGMERVWRDGKIAWVGTWVGAGKMAGEGPKFLGRNSRHFPNMPRMRVG